jgi:WD40 repeat protein
MIGEEGLAEMTVQPKNPITMAYQSHDSPIYSVSFSPFHRHVFLTSAHDGQIRIYSQLFVREKPLPANKSNYLSSRIMAVVSHQLKARFLLAVGRPHVLFF